MCLKADLEHIRATTPVQFVFISTHHHIPPLPLPLHLQIFLFHPHPAPRNTPINWSRITSQHVSGLDKRLPFQNFTAATAMTSAGGLIAFCLTLLTLLGATLGGKASCSVCVIFTLQSYRSLCCFLCVISSASKGYILNEPNIPFPPARPTFQNLGNICFHGQSRPRYPHNFFPSSGFSYFRRIGRTINRLESWYSLCCRGLAQDFYQILCCTEQAVSFCNPKRADPSHNIFMIKQKFKVRELVFM